MSRRFGAAMLIAAGIVVGCALSSYEGTRVAAAPASRAADDPEAAAVDQLVEIKTQLKEINALLHKGHVKVVVLLNPDAR